MAVVARIESIMGRDAWATFWRTDRSKAKHVARKLLPLHGGHFSGDGLFIVLPNGTWWRATTPRGELTVEASAPQRIGAIGGMI